MIITSAQFNQAYKKLPFTLREYIADDEVSPIAEEIGQEFGLHIDTVGALEREITNMLLGILSPEQFVGELRSMGIPQESIGSIVKELNAKVFMPIREKMKNAPPEEPRVVVEEPAPAPVAPPQPVQQAPIPVAPVARPVFTAPPAYVATPPTPAPVYTPPMYVPPTVPTPQAAAPAPAVPAYVPPAPTTPAYVPPARVIPAYQSPTTPLPPLVPPKQPVFTHSIPGAVPPSVFTPPGQVPAAPAQAPDPTSPPISVSTTNPQLRPEPFATVVPDVHIPARTMAQDMDTAQGKPAASAPAPTANRDALHSVLKGYGVDPYREPAT